MSNQEKMPFVEALESYKEQHFVPFHTPGHKIGVEAPQLLKDWMGPALPYDLGVMYALDDLHEPERELKEAQDLTAELYGADDCWFSINGTTALIEAMIMGSVGPDEMIIIPREAHRSVISGLVLSGAKPVYMDCQFDERWGIPLGVSLEDAVRTMDAHPEAKAILLVYPNYYGVGVDIVKIVKEAHKRGMIVLVDEAHGPHLPFSENLPVEAIAAGADLVAQSTHKSVGSLTQTSWLLGQGERINKRRITQMHQMLQSTSPNYIFLASLDMARHQLATEGKALISRTVELSLYLRHELNKISGITTMEYIDIQERVVNYDCTKVLIDAKVLGLTGVEFERMLREYRIEVELVQAHHVLVLITIGDTKESVTSLIQAVQAISDTILHTSKVDNSNVVEHAENLSKDSSFLPKPIVRVTPRNAMYANREQVPLRDALHRIAGETIAYYPPGIPCVAVGEEISSSVLQYIENRKALGYVPNGADDMSLETIWVLQE
ncbi:aminotransferase class I/II-fold pyridoxal phosphate-dependent enzyme [Veillonella sp.]|uniref:aminotransferase class I/II-fold pyridoxal phosphate-dependent enzyme n=1 Tax=Veillonella sp. TaxID=1926307 RepID=UPI0028FEFF10|nr:aminotransferase class I/II-fold pyridoxal phosphate-dependent enzyme [Veillonella sp.]MDU2462348.1 aminotransferase class I/II-fold pyridoxal phosphate-dependent enzyme [Veillonella sp.]MDU3878796.1 aminotransferase class I/II-fold pyridoxal phosphate-dependent enzyme [Veillonella sp.]